jgi:hypothetical protein
MTVQVKDVDRGYAKMLATVRSLAEGDVGVVVGILSDKGGQTHEGGARVLDVAIWNEFGTVDADGKTKTPARSFVRAWFDAHKVEGHKKLTGLLRQVVAHKLTEDQALEQFGAWCQGSMQAWMAKGIPPPNAAATIRAKGSSTPLIGKTGQLRSSVSHATRRG